MKLALGLFHFNPHWNCDPRSGHRHCSESFGPFLRMLVNNPGWHVDVEISGSGLEFVNAYYPEQIRMLHSIVDRGQVELISSLYTPSIWVAFPRRDLLKSIEFNRRCLKKLGFEWSRIFFAQEAFFGSGVRVLHEHFDAAVCKDDYLAFQCDVSPMQSLYMLDGMKVVVGSNHIVNELARSVQQKALFLNGHRLSHTHLQHLMRRAREISDNETFPAAHCQCDGIEWLWYHCGDGNYMGTLAKPNDLDHCYYDRDWSSACFSQVKAYEDQGFRLATIREFLDNVDYSSAPQLPPIVEGGWNSTKSDGVFCWMGRNNTEWEEDLSVLAAVSRARARVVQAEDLIARSNGPSAVSQVQKLDRAWSTLLHAEISDPLGWCAGPLAIVRAIRYCDEALMLATQLIEEAGRDAIDDVDASDGLEIFENPADVPDVEWPDIQFDGADGVTSFRELSSRLRLYDCAFTQSQDHCGIRVPFKLDRLVYCPTGLEEHPVAIPWDSLRIKSPTVPLSNGLLQLSEHLYLIKDIGSVHAAARIDRERQCVEFGMSGGPMKKRNFEWRFFLLAGTLDYAVRVANTVNWV
jgi:hypothetical protein